MKRWKVAKHYGIWYAIEHGWKRYNAFPNRAEAMAYADRKSRLAPDITIEDPSGALCDLTATFETRDRIALKAGDDASILARHEWKPLAYFLLDAAKYQEEA